MDRIVLKVSDDARSELREDDRGTRRDGPKLVASCPSVALGIGVVVTAAVVVEAFVG
ncbi:MULTISPECIES: hypothetical protein [unclassified Streptomyces]|uniref:hypothetical protein n=1 Tax=unclassified Streptomyces TaxID=2593676 RepID=UPI001906E9CD|nr:hypothetical protein [Streptomyces sp. HSG2]